MAQQIISNGEGGLSARNDINGNFTELYGISFTPSGQEATITTLVGAAAASKAGENIVATNASPNGMYSIRFAALNKTGIMTAGDNDIADTLISRYNDIRSGSAWGRWDVMQGPLNPASGLPGAPLAAQGFNLVASEVNPQNRHGDVVWAGETRRFANGVSGQQMVAETQDFTSLLPAGTRRGYTLSFGYCISRSPYTNDDQQRHARFVNGILTNPNSIAPDGANFFAVGYHTFPTAVVVAGGGTGYTAGDILTFATGLGQAANENTQVRVKTVNGSGVILTAEIWNAGWYQQSFASPVGVTGGTGSSATFTYTMSTDAEAPRAAFGITGTWDYGIDAGTWQGVDSNVGGGRFLGGLIRGLNNQNLIVGRNAADSADVALLKLNASDRVELAGERIDPWTAWTPTIAADAGTFTTVTLDPTLTVWQRINGMVYARLAFTVTAIGTASGSFRISGLPVTPSSWVDVSGINDTDGLVMGGFYNGTFARVSRYDGAAPILNAKAYTITLAYRA